MSAHWYLDKQLFQEGHPKWDTLEPWPLTKAGTRRKLVGWHDRLAAGLKPSVTTWLSAIKGDSVGGLMGFAAKLGRDVGWEMATDWDYEKRDEPYAKQKFWSEYRTRRDEYSEVGTAIHNAIEQGLKGDPLKVMSFVEAKASIQASNWLSEHGLLDGGEAEAIVQAQDYAGMVDWFCPSKRVIVDWKTIRDEEGKKVRGPYPSELVQVAAYWNAWNDLYNKQEAPPFPAVNVYISQRTGEIINVRWWTADEVQRGFALFLLAQCVTTDLKSIERNI